MGDRCSVTSEGDEGPGSDAITQAAELCGLRSTSNSVDSGYSSMAASAEGSIELSGRPKLGEETSQQQSAADVVVVGSWPLRARLKCLSGEIPEAAQRRLVDFKVLFAQQLYEIVSKSCPSRASISLQLRYLGTSETDQSLYLVVQCDKAAAKPLKRFFGQDHVREQFRDAFLIHVLAKPPRKLADDDAVEVYTFPEGLWLATEVEGTLCGLPIVARYKDKSLSGTLGGVIMVRNQQGEETVYGMTAGHIFEELGLQKEEDQSGDNRLSLSSLSPEPYDEPDSDSEFELDLDGLPEDTTLPAGSESSFASVLIGHTSELLMPYSSYDWCLIQLLRNHCFPNLSDGVSITQGHQPLDSAQHDAAVLSRRFKPTEGILRNQQSSLVTGPGPGFIDTYDFLLKKGERLLPGDSGSWVVASDGSGVYGHLVGANAFGDAYIVPMRACLEDIRSKLDCIAAYLPSARELEEYRHAATIPNISLITHPDPGNRVSINFPQGKPPSVVELSRGKGDSYDKLAPKKTPARKRNKTGCLTCRRRRIKCDEGRPICSNCIKSKKHCEGFNQRVTFKEPLNAFQHANSFGPHSEFAVPATELPYASRPLPPQPTLTEPSLSVIAPRPPSLDSASGIPFQSYQGQSGYATSSQGPTPFSPHGQMLPTPGEAPQPLREASEEVIYWLSDDESSMSESEEEEISGSLGDANFESKSLWIQIASQFSGSVIRPFIGFVNDNVLETYRPSATHSPLTDVQTASIFWYFVNVTAPSMSLYERHPFIASILFRGDPVPKVNQHIWAYTVPIMSFYNPALLQAILALGSLQMAKLQGLPPTASMKHYHLSLRRLAKNYQSAHRRTQPATLAATLLLGFYEAWSSDHQKWCTHIAGARALLEDIPLKQMTKQMLALKRAQRQKDFKQDSDLPSLQEAVPGIESVSTVFVSDIVGRNVSYDDFGKGHETQQRLYTEYDIETFEQLSDLFWWYCKMDVHQSILGGAKLLMDYDLWIQCPPRAPLGRTDAVYGTFDHLVLLLGRMTNFASNDVARKRRAKQASENALGDPRRSGQSPPIVSGPVTDNPHIALPIGFSPPHEPSPPPSELTGELDLEASTKVAIQEWESIRLAFETFRAQLGSEFDPVGPDLVMPEATPFGPSKKFRSYSIACVWINYYMGLVSLYRAHPSMPPITLIAAGMSAQHTMPWALEIGRIAAGLHENLDVASTVSTLQGAALIESSVCLFVGSLQFRDLPRRQWAIKRLHHIARLTGWQPAQEMADGCESAWNKAALLGRGPPYERPPKLERKDPPLVLQAPRRIQNHFWESDDEKSIVLAKTVQAQYAFGLLALEHDLERLEPQNEN